MTYTTTCPATVCTCGGTEQVTVRPGYDKRTGRATLTYWPCAPLVAQGWRPEDIASVEWITDGATTLLRHRNGLVAFTA